MIETDWIAMCALVVACISVVVSLYALRETRRANQLVLLERREAIYDAFKQLALDALCEGENLASEATTAFEPHAESANKYLPKVMADEVKAFYEDCQTVVWAQGLRQPVDDELRLKAEQARTRVHASALAIQERLLALVRHSAAA